VQTKLLPAIGAHIPVRDGLQPRKVFPLAYEILFFIGSPYYREAVSRGNLDVIRNHDNRVIHSGKVR
jgi:hypothetical protein